jgi:hypothetical protein
MTAPDAAPAANCTLELLDSQGDVTDMAIVTFSVNATVTDLVPVSDGTRDALTGGDNGNSTARTCKERCGSMFNVLCLYWKGCTSELTGAIGIVLGGFLSSTLRSL